MAKSKNTKKPEAKEEVKKVEEVKEEAKKPVVKTDYVVIRETGRQLTEDIIRMAESKAERIAIERGFNEVYLKHILSNRIGVYEFVFEIVGWEVEG